MPEDIFELDDLTVPIARRRIVRSDDRVLLIEGVSVKVGRGKTLGIQGPSGAGKSTLARAAVGLNPLASGRVLLDGSDILAMSAAELRRVRQRIQLVLQNSASLSPYRRIRDILYEPLRNFGIEKSDWSFRVNDIMEHMSLTPQLADRYPNQLSGGQQQRVSIARALIAEPDVVVFDEPVSSLDRVVQLSVLDDLRNRQQKNSLTFVIITHDPKIASYMCDQVLTIVDGRIV